MEYRLSDLFELQMGKTPDRSNTSFWNNGIFPWISISDLSKSEKYILNTVEYITQDAVEKSGIKRIPANTVVMSFKLSIGKVAITSKEMYSNEAIMAFIDKGIIEINSNYLFYLLKCRNWDSGTNKAVMGKTLNKATLSQIKIYVHNSMIQKEIVEVLDKVNDLISKRKKQLELLNELVQARFIEMFGDPETNPKGWERQRLDQICENLDSRRVPITSTDRKTGNYPYYGASGIVDYVEDYIFDEDILLISEDGANLVMRSTPIAFSVSGKVWVNNHAHVLRFESKATQIYIEVCFALTDISVNITGTAQPKLNQAKLNAMMFCIPPINLQQQFATFVEQTDKSKLIKRKL